MSPIRFSETCAFFLRTGFPGEAAADDDPALARAFLADPPAPEDFFFSLPFLSPLFPEAFFFASMIEIPSRSCAE